MSGAHPMNEITRSSGAPWVLLGLAGGTTVTVVTVGLTPTVVAAGVVLQVIFFVYFLRHLSFVVGACAGAPADLEPVAADVDHTPSVTVLVACHNERAVVDRLATSLLALDYPTDLLQLVLIDDGSSDGTGARLDQLASTTSRLEVMHRPAGAGGGKSGALNEAIGRLRGEVVVVFDADHAPEPDCVRRLVRHFADPAVGSVQGRCVIRNADDSIISRLVGVDYLAGYLVNEYGRQSVFSLPAYGGANCAVRTSSLIEVGGWNVESVTEDTDLTIRLLLRGERVRYDVTAVDHEEGVETLDAYWRQRYRWARGHQQVCRDYRGAVVRSDRLGLGQKLETLLFLHSFHVPVLGTLGLVTLALWFSGLTQPIDPLGGFVLWTLLFLGPLLELGTGLLLAERPRRDAITIAMFLPLFVVSMALCTKAWFDSVAGSGYRWVKTGRAGDAHVTAGATA